MRTVNIKIALTLDIPEDADHDEIDDLLNELDYEFSSASEREVMMQYRYHINLHERGEFYADVRDIEGETVWELHTEQALELCEDGFIHNVCNADEIGEYLIQVGILNRGDELVKG